MIKIKIKPLEGIEIENVGNLYLGQLRSDVEKLLGITSESDNPNQVYYYNYELRVDYDTMNEVEFIEFLFGPFPSKTELSIYGHNPFLLKAEELLRLLIEKNDGEIDDQEAKYGYAFLNISVGIWREATPEDIEESIIENKQNGNYEHNKSWLLEEFEKSTHFWTIGIGKSKYYSLSNGA